MHEQSSETRTNAIHFNHVLIWFYHDGIC